MQVLVSGKTQRHQVFCWSTQWMVFWLPPDLQQMILGFYIQTELLVYINHKVFVEFQEKLEKKQKKTFSSFLWIFFYFKVFANVLWVKTNLITQKYYLWNSHTLCLLTSELLTFHSLNSIGFSRAKIHVKVASDLCIYMHILRRRVSDPLYVALCYLNS